MGYNKFRWYTKGRPKKPLPASAPLLLKIRNGDFDYSYMFSEARMVREEATRVYEEAYKNYIGSDEHNRKMAAEDSARMKRVKALKLDEKANEEEMKILNSLKNEFALEFGKDLWEKAMQRKRGKGTIEDLYWWYKKQVGFGQTPSEIAIQLGRKTTKGLR
jgi:HD superfamily phosphohydrolase